MLEIEAEKVKASLKAEIAAQLQAQHADVRVAKTQLSEEEIRDILSTNTTARVKFTGNLKRELETEREKITATLMAEFDEKLSAARETGKTAIISGGNGLPIANEILLFVEQAASDIIPIKDIWTEVLTQVLPSSSAKSPSPTTRSTTNLSKVQSSPKWNGFASKHPVEEQRSGFPTSPTRSAQATRPGISSGLRSFCGDTALMSPFSRLAGSEKRSRDIEDASRDEPVLKKACLSSGIKWMDFRGKELCENDLEDS